MAYSIEDIKRKQWLKLKRPFNDAANLEVYMNDKWYRVTGNDFRAWSGRRRITEHHVSGTKHEINQYEYEGPVYARDTNIEYVGEVVNRMINRSEIKE